MIRALLLSSVIFAGVFSLSHFKVGYPWAGAKYLGKEKERRQTVLMKGAKVLSHGKLMDFKKNK